VVTDVAVGLLVTLVIRVTDIPVIAFAAVVYNGYQCSSLCAQLLFCYVTHFARAVHDPPAKPLLF
jgi:hypothetical protein